MFIHKYSIWKGCKISFIFFYKTTITTTTITTRAIIGNNNNNNNNNSIQLFVIYVPSQQTQHSVDASNYIVDKHDIKSKTNYRRALKEKQINAEKKANKQTKMWRVTRTT
jgi:hypothetical protein